MPNMDMEELEAAGGLRQCWACCSGSTALHIPAYVCTGLHGRVKVCLAVLIAAMGRQGSREEEDQRVDAFKQLFKPYDIMEA